MTDGGIGLRLDSSPEAYSRFVQARGATAEAPAAEDSLAPFEVLLKLRGAPRSRGVRMEAASGEDAAQRALAKAGQDWEVLEVRPRAARSESSPET